MIVASGGLGRGFLVHHAKLTLISCQSFTMRHPGALSLGGTGPTKLKPFNLH